LRVADRVNFLGYVSQPFDVFSAVDVAVVPSLWNEAFGRVVVEAMACGTAVIATAVGGMRELFEDGHEGIFVPKADAVAIAEAINRLARDHHELRAMQRAGRELAERRYSTARVAAEYAALYQRVEG
jgi:glycosyltransferase involved in cell wall biosynthesis